jgi:hypothetical protein
MLTTLIFYINHVIFFVFHTKSAAFTTFDIKVGLYCASLVFALLTSNIHHTILLVLSTKPGF